MRAPITTSIAIAVGLIVLMGYFLPFPGIQVIQIVLLGWAAILAGAATLVGILNLLRVHWRKLFAVRRKDVYSIMFILAFLATVGAGFWLGPDNVQFQQVVLAIQAPIETSLVAVLAITLSYAGLRFLQRRKSFMAVGFLLSALVFLVLSSGLLTSGENVPVLGLLLAFLNRLPVAGGRGILLGIALGSLTAGLRILLGADRPYSG